MLVPHHGNIIMAEEREGRCTWQPLPDPAAHKMIKSAEKGSQPVSYYTLM
jgi:hypothetical protein